MAATAKRYDSSKVIVGSGDLWANLAVPAAGQRLKLVTGTPDSVENPLATHLGHTAEGTTITTNITVTDHFADETPFPIKASVDQMTMEMTGNLLQIFDEEVVKVLAAQFGTYGTAAGYKQFTLGRKATLQYTNFALIVPTPMDATKYSVIMLYNGVNAAGLNFQIGSKVRSQTPFTFRGYALTARAEADQMGNYWWQI
jgi:hypothetical protein